MIVRSEPWGAWVKIDEPPALVALDHDGVRALGLKPEPSRPAPIEVHLAVTSRCAAGCEGCYLDARPDGVEPPRATMLAALDALRDARVFTVAFGGGEPTLREDLGDLARAAKERGIAPVVTTSGLGLGPRKIAQLAAFAQVNVSYDGASEDYAKVRGFDGASEAESAIERISAAGIAVGVNVVLTRATFARVSTTVRRAVSLGAREVQLLRYKPAGRARSADYLAKRLEPAQTRGLGALCRALAAEHGDRVRIRIDCALVPFFSADPAIAARPAELAKWGVMGCEAGAALGAVRADGRVAGCSFAEPTTLDVTELASGWGGEPGLAAFRAFPEAPPEPCASCTLRAVCRGGCKIVAGGFEPDPECPRVRGDV